MACSMHVGLLYTYETELYTYTHKYKFYCVVCHNTRNLYHIRVIDYLTIEFHVSSVNNIPCSIEMI